MAYTKHDWQTGETITETLLDNMEAGIANAYITKVTVTADNNTGTPTATGNVNGNTLTLDFKNLKGAKGDKGDTGAGLKGTAVAVAAIATEAELAAVTAKVNEIITQLKARGITA